ncbi:MAG: T9SS type A sorting domain-containing protein [Candidatus Marinimicrobia bacterium]|nr:T9SS type A sorting domain-containing protein [Candidatus Neomarinimicrobiota bacterium]
MRLKLFTVLPIVLIFILQASLFAKITNGPRRMGATNSIGNLAKSAGNHLNPAKTILSINNITSWVQKNGFFPWDYPGGWNGSHPKGTVGVVFAEGIVWGAKVSGDGDDVNPRVNGSTYANGLSSGKVLGWRSPSDPLGYSPPTGRAVEADQQIWRVRTDYLTADLKSDAQSFVQIPIGDVTDDDVDKVFETYDFAWKNWPAVDGAPYDDVDGNGVYDPAVDVPGFPGASQTIWLVANDLDPLISTRSYGSPPIGLEMQMTLWGYDFASTSPLGNITYKRVRIIYTGKFDGLSTAHIDTMYLSQWSDPDLGFFTDDYVGTDVEKSLGYVYNGTAKDPIYFGDFGLAVPAAGYDFLQGPIVDGKRLGMSSFTFFGAGSDISDPDLGVYEGTLQWFNLMEGFLPRPAYPIQLPLLDPLTGEETKFWLSGDPVTGVGWIDGIILPPGDRRLIMTTGPFEMALGDTQDLVLAFMGGTGKDNISSITVMKFHDDFAQFAFDNNFDLPSPPIGPIATAAGFSLENSNQGRVTLTWNTDESDQANTEDVVSKGFAFEGYNVYQLPNATSTLSEGIKVATYDVINLVQTIFDLGVDIESGFIVQQPKQSGSNSGLQRFFTTTEDAVRGRPLSTGIEYFFAVTAYSFLADNVGAPFKTLESSPVVLSVRPQAPAPGTAFMADYGSDVDVTHSKGGGFGQIAVEIIDQSALVDATYTISFNGGLPAASWNLAIGGTQIVKSDEDFTEAEDRRVINGFTLKIVTGAPVTFAEIGPVTAGAGLSLWGDYQLFGGRTGSASEAGWAGGTDDINIITKDLEFRFTGIAPDNDSPVTTGGSWSTQWERGSFGEGDLSTFRRISVRVPFEVWDVEDPANARQVNAAVVNRNADDASPYGNDIGDASTARYRMTGRDYIVIVMTDYDGSAEFSTVTDTLIIDGEDTTLVYTSSPGFIDPGDDLATWLLFFEEQGGSVWATGDVYGVAYANPVTGGVDEYTFTTTAPTTGNDTQAQADVEKINVFPNPYFGVHENETSRFDKFVTFNHLPQEATIRIFSLGGEMAKVINKKDESQFLRWDLTNQGGFPVASGIYIVHIDMGKLGTKILKLALVQEEQILRTY